MYSVVQKRGNEPCIDGVSLAEIVRSVKNVLDREGEGEGGMEGGGGGGGGRRRREEKNILGRREDG